MKILVIPDVHLKPWIFSRASELIKEKAADLAICLMDIPDDWNQQFNIDLYIKTFDAAIAFAKEIRTHYGATEIMMSAICGISGKLVIPQ